MKLSRRTILQGVGSLPFAVASLRVGALAQTATRDAEIPPILFVHGNGDYDALWMTTLWRMESNGVARERMMAINFTDPLARNDDKVEQTSRSSTEDQRRELAAAVTELKRRTGAPRVALVGSSRGGYAIRNVIKNGGAGDVSHAVLCGTPNHGVFATDDQPNNEFNGRGVFLRGLNEGDSEVTPGVTFLTLRSDGMDKYAQPDGRFIGKPGTPTGVTAEGPELKGATNLVLGALDHREVAFHPRAFREIYKFIAGREPTRIAVVSEPGVRLSGLVTGTPGGAPTNRPVADATVDVFRVDPDTESARVPRCTAQGPVQTAAGGRRRSIPPGRSSSSWPRQARRPRTSIDRPFRARPMSCTCGLRARSGRPTRMREPSRSCRGRAAISACRGTLCCLMARNRPTSSRACPRMRQQPCGFRPARSGVTSWLSSAKNGSWREPGRPPRTGLRLPS